MKSKLTIPVLVIFLCIVGFVSLSSGAESTADVSADAALKEKARRQIMGQSVPLPAGDEYLVGYRDILHVSVYGEGSMAISEAMQASAAAAGNTGNTPAGAAFLRGRGSGIEVRIDGRISLRHIGDVSVVGMTLTQLADYLKELYSTIYEDPIMTVTLVQSNSQQYTVMGQVLNPGLFHLDYPLTIVNAVARAGGFTEWANSDITVIRHNAAGPALKKTLDGNGQTFEFDYDDFLKGKELEKNILIKPGDVVVVH